MTQNNYEIPTTATPLEKRIKLAVIDPKQAVEEIGDFLVERVLLFGKTGGVLGLSGGVDSTTVAAIAKHGFDKYNTNHPSDRPLELVGYCLPSKTNSPDDTRDGVAVAERLGIRYEVKSIEEVVCAYQSTNPEAFGENAKFHKGNMMSEIRATVLHVKAATENKHVFGTGNKDEDFGIGYYTLFGDGAVHISPIGNLPKRVVREVATYLGFSDLANRVPTAGLEPGQTDFKDLCYSYDAVEIVTEGLRQGFKADELKKHSQVVPIIQRDLAQYEKQYGAPKLKSVSDVINDIEHRHMIAYAKAEIISPKIAPVTMIYQ